MPKTTLAMAKGDTTPEAVPKGNQEVGEYITLRVGGVSDAWKQYGLLEAPLLLAQREGDKTQFIPSNYKLVLRGQGGNTAKVSMPKQRETFRLPEGVQAPATQADLIAILSREYELYPNEELVKVMDRWTAENHYKRYEDARYSFTSGSGNAVFLTYLPRDEEVGSYFVGDRRDKVRLGFVARNSIDGSVGFGLDVFTFRGICYNGSIVMNETGLRAWNPYQVSQNATAKLKHRHTKGLSEVIEHLDTNIEQLQVVGEQVIAYYQHLATVKLNQVIAEHLANTMIPEKYFQQTGITFEKEKDKKGKILSEKVVVEQNKDMWTVYNDLTQAIWHNAQTDMRSKFQYFNVLHSTLGTVVPMPQARV